MPLYYPNLYVTTQVRNHSNSVATMESALSGIKVLMSFCDESGIDLTERLLKRKFFLYGELDAIRDYCQLDFGMRGAEPVEKVRSIAPKLKQKPARKTGIPSEYMRLTHIAKYVEWLAKILLAGNVDRETALEIAEMKKGLDSRRPSGKGRNQLGKEKGLSQEQESALLEVVQPHAERNPFEDEAIQVRNQLANLLLLHLGIRSGELLSIKVKDIDWSNNQIVIARRADDKKDPRIKQPTAKTLDRRLPLKDTLVQAIHKYVTHYRRKVPGVRTCEHLLVTHKSGPTQGQPMSRSTLNKVICMVRKSDPSLATLHAHELRHTWNNRFSEYMDSKVDAPTPEEQEKQRSYLQGWKQGSGSAAIYTKRFTREKALEAGLKLQDGITRVPENLPND